MVANNIVSTGIWLSKRTIFSSYAQGISFLIVIMANFLLVPSFGILGASVALSLGAFTKSIATYNFSQRLHPIPFQYWRVNGLIFSLLFLGWIHSNLVLESGLMESLALDLPTAFSFILLSWFLCFKKRQRKEVSNLLKDQWHSCLDYFRRLFSKTGINRI